MRIVDEWTEGNIRVTVFNMNSRFSIKLERGLLEQTYKFRDDQFENIQELKSALTPEFYKECNKHFINMDLLRSRLIPAGTESDTFPEII